MERNKMEQLKELNLNRDDHPILFESGSSPRTSERYGHINTIVPIDIIRDFGWVPRDVVVSKTNRNKSNDGFQKHRVRFFNPKLPTFDGNFVELLLSNSHDGSTSFKLQLGVYRLVCSNGLVVGDTLQAAKVKHIGFTATRIENAINFLLPNCESVINNIGQYARVNLDAEKRSDFARQVLEMRLENTKYEINSEVEANILRPNRYEDNKTDLWTTMNVIQENVVRRGFMAPKKEKYGFFKVRPIKCIASTDAINKQIWNTTEALHALATKI